MKHIFILISILFLGLTITFFFANCILISIMFLVGFGIYCYLIFLLIKTQNKIKKILS
jgi:hypothetical protein